MEKQLGLLKADISAALNDFKDQKWVEAEKEIESRIIKQSIRKFLNLDKSDYRTTEYVASAYGTKVVR